MSVRSYKVEPPVNIPAVNQDRTISIAWQTWFSSYVTAQLGKVSTVTATTDPPNINAGQWTSLTVPAPGATRADFAQVSFEGADPDVLMFAHVSANDVITVWFHNPSGSPVDLPEAALRVRWEKP